MAFTAMEFQARLPSFPSYLMNYRGYGGSSGYPEEMDCIADALQLYDSQIKCTTTRLCLLGAALAVSGNLCCIPRPVSRISASNTFRSVENVAPRAISFLFPIWILLKRQV